MGDALQGTARFQSVCRICQQPQIIPKRRLCWSAQVITGASASGLYGRAAEVTQAQTLHQAAVRRLVGHRSQQAAAFHTKSVQMAEPLPVATTKLLQGTDDTYMGVLVDAASLPDDPAEFSSRLESSLEAWKGRQRKGIWLKVPAHQASLIPPAVSAGFDFHHAEKDYVMLTKWLADTENKLPANASHQVGVGAFVVNERKEVLVVQELNGPLRGKGVWKMVTGLVNAGEDIHTAAEREVLEETGVRARFDAVLAIRQSHGFAFGKSDFFFVCALRPEPGQEELVKQEDELEAVQWMPIEEYAAIPFTANRPLFKVIIDRCMAYAEGRFRGFKADVLDNSFGGKVRNDLLIYGEDDVQQLTDGLPAGTHKL